MLRNNLVYLDDTQETSPRARLQAHAPSECVRLVLLCWGADPASSRPGGARTTSPSLQGRLTHSKAAAKDCITWPAELSPRNSL